MSVGSTAATYALVPDWPDARCSAVLTGRRKAGNETIHEGRLTHLFPTRQITPDVFKRLRRPLKVNVIVSVVVAWVANALPHQPGTCADRYACDVPLVLAIAVVSPVAVDSAETQG